MIIGSGVRALADEAGKHGAAKVYVADDAQLEAPLPQPRVDVLAKLVARQRLRHGAVRATRCSPPTSPPASPRGSTRA